MPQVRSTCQGGSSCAGSRRGLRRHRPGRPGGEQARSPSCSGSPAVLRTRCPARGARHSHGPHGHGLPAPWPRSCCSASGLESHQGPTEQAPQRPTVQVPPRGSVAPRLPTPKPTGATLGAELAGSEKALRQGGWSPGHTSEVRVAAYPEAKGAQGEWVGGGPEAPGLTGSQQQAPRGPWTHFTAKASTRWRPQDPGCVGHVPNPLPLPRPGAAPRWLAPRGPRPPWWGRPHAAPGPRPRDPKPDGPGRCTALRSLPRTYTGVIGKDTHPLCPVGTWRPGPAKGKTDQVPALVAVVGEPQTRANRLHTLHRVPVYGP